MAYFGSVETVAAQAAPREKFEAAFAYVRELFAPGSAAAERLRALGVGESNRIELAGGAFALEQVYRTKVRADGFFESHRKYIDVQVVFEGEECMEVIDLARATERQPYQGERDLIVYHDAPGASPLQLSAGQAAVFFPADVHMPALQGRGAARLVRKSVVKVPV